MPRRGVRWKRKCPGEGLEGRESAQERGGRESAQERGWGRESTQETGYREEKVPSRGVGRKRKCPGEGLEGRESTQERG